jgi:hypothetical protein
MSDEAAHGRLALIKAEQRKVDSLKHLNMPWVFVEPTRINFAKPARRPRKPGFPPQGDEDELGFLNQSTADFTPEDLEVLSEAIHNPRQASRVRREEFEALSGRISNSHSIAMQPSYIGFVGPPQQPDDDQQLLTGRSADRDSLFEADSVTDDPAHEKTATEDIAETETVRSLILHEMHERERAKAPVYKPVNLSRFESIEGHSVRTAPPTLGRRKLLRAVDRASSTAYETDSLSHARTALGADSAFKRAALESCLGVQSFRGYLVESKSRIPESFPLLDPP